MTNLQINLDNEALKQATIQAINGVLTPEMKEKILEKAITSLLAPSTNSWERGQSPIEAIFQTSVLEIARKEAERLVTEDEGLRERMKSLLKITMEKVMETDVEKLTQRMADALVNSFRER